MFNVWLSGDYLYGKWLFAWLSLMMSLMVSYLCCPFSHEMSLVRSGTELSQFLRIFLTTFAVSTLSASERRPAGKYLNNSPGLNC